MREAEQKYNGELVVLFVDEQETVAEVEAFAIKHDLASEFVMDNTGALATNYRLLSTPTTYFLDKNGVIQNMQTGIITVDWLDRNMAVQQ